LNIYIAPLQENYSEAIGLPVATNTTQTLHRAVCDLSNTALK